MKTRFVGTIVLSASLVGVSLCALRASPNPGGYVAHEWGTFTSVQASDGVQMPWNPVNVAELPDFVYSLAWPEGKKAGRQNVLAAKTALLSVQRMETPVIYFYADAPRTVNVSVSFPSGTITEWYPHADRANGFGEWEANRARPADGRIAWNSVNILPPDEKGAPRQEASGSHYYAARETDANLLRIDSPRGPEIEKFLFYRGVASFRAPLTVTQTGDEGEAIELRNSGSEGLHSLFVYQVQGDRAAWTLVPNLAPGDAKTVRLQFARQALAVSEFRNEVAPALRKALVAEGLYAPEAAAMVKTWDDSWFSEQGLRVLYVLPRAWTDQTLPLALSPSPRQTARVMVGRAELITPSVETKLLQEMARYASSDEPGRAQAIENVRKLSLGRFADAAMRRILSRTPVTREFSNRAWELLMASSKAPAAKKLAQN